MTALFKLTIASHHFVVSNVAVSTARVITEFSRKFVQFGFVRESGRNIRTALKVYAAATDSRSEYRFHINALRDFREHLDTCNISKLNVEEVVRPTYETDHVDFIVKPQWVAREDQIPLVDYLVKKGDPKSRLVSLQTGKGKEQPLYSKIKVPGGWSTMGAMKVGTVITARDGTPTKVTAIHPQGRKQVYKITFADGRQTEAGAEHLWRVYYISTTPDKRWRVVNTLEVLRLISMPNPRVYIELIEAEDSADVDLPIDPYVLGVLLGDGCIVGLTPVITTPDQFIVDELTRLLPETVTLSKKSSAVADKCPSYSIIRNKDVVPGRDNPFTLAIRKAGLDGHLSHEKFVPQEYIHASRSQRLALLQGLMDTDGTVNTIATGGAVSFSSTSIRLAESVQYLVRSLGGIASITKRYTKYNHNGEKKQGRLCYEVSIRHKTPGELFRLPKKKERTNDSNQYAESLKLRVVSVAASTVEECQCISVEAPDHLYVTDDFIVTHNTFVTMLSMSKICKRTVVIVKPGYMEKWVSDFVKTYEIGPEDVMVVAGGAQLMALLALQEAGELTQNLIVISNKTYQNWLTLYEANGSRIRDMGYACLPDELFEFLRAGVRLVDETHQDFHLNFKMDMYTHVPLSISLSATLITNDAFMQRMYELMFPMADRAPVPPLDKYIRAIGLVYRMKPGRERFVKTSEYGSTSYSHLAFEKSIMKSESLQDSYFEAIKFSLDATYIKKYVKGDKFIVFAATIELCTRIRDYLKDEYPNLNIRKYTSGDPMTHLLESDGVVSTLGSAGTAHDIPGLTTVVQTTSIDSPQANVQSFGRLRKIAGRDVDFVFFSCVDISKQMQYFERKKHMLLDRAASFRTVNLPFMV